MSDQGKKGEKKQIKKSASKKRVSLLQNIERRHDEMFGIIPVNMEEEYKKVVEKIVTAWSGIESPDAAYLVDAAASAQSMFTESVVKTGLKIYVVNQGRRDERSRISEAKWELWAKTATEYIEQHPTVLAQWGGKLNVAKYVAKQHEAKIETVRRALREMGIT